MSFLILIYDVVTNVNNVTIPANNLYVITRYYRARFGLVIRIVDTKLKTKVPHPSIFSKILQYTVKLGYNEQLGTGQIC